jgi:hypothetical protein
MSLKNAPEKFNETAKQRRAARDQQPGWGNRSHFQIVSGSIRCRRVSRADGIKPFTPAI